jgi:hypothetical protein
MNKSPYRIVKKAITPSERPSDDEFKNEVKKVMAELGPKEVDWSFSYNEGCGQHCSVRLEVSNREVINRLDEKVKKSKGLFLFCPH